MPLETEVAGGLLTLLFGVFAWMFKGTAKRANDASALSKELKTRVEKLEATSEKVTEIRIDQATIRNDVAHVKDSVDMIVTHFIKEKSNDK